VKPYPDSLKQDLVRKLLAPNGPNATQLAQRTQVSQATLSRWLLEATTVRGAMPKRKDDEREQPASRVGSARSPRELSPSDKLRLVQESASLDETALGAFLRREGVHHADLTAWRAQVAEGALGALAGKRQRTGEQKRLRQLEAELRRKDRALAETAALLVLSKKMQALWGDNEDDDTTGNSEP